MSAVPGPRPTSCSHRRARVVSVDASRTCRWSAHGRPARHADHRAGRRAGRAGGGCRAPTVSRRRPWSSSIAGPWWTAAGAALGQPGRVRRCRAHEDPVQRRVRFVAGADERFDVIIVDSSRREMRGARSCSASRSMPHAARACRPGGVLARPVRRSVGELDRLAGNDSVGAAFATSLYAAAVPTSSSRLLRTSAGGGAAAAPGRRRLVARAVPRGSLSTSPRSMPPHWSVRRRLAAAIAGRLPRQRPRRPAQSGRSGGVRANVVPADDRGARERGRAARSGWRPFSRFTVEVPECRRVCWPVWTWRRRTGGGGRAQYSPRQAGVRVSAHTMTSPRA